MLIKSLKLAGYKYFDPIFIAFCGIASSLLNLLKTITEKKIFISLQPQEQTKENNEKGM